MDFSQKLINCAAQLFDRLEYFLYGKLFLFDRTYFMIKDQDLWRGKCWLGISWFNLSDQGYHYEINIVGENV